MIPEAAKAALDMGILSNPIEFAEAISLSGIAIIFGYFVFKVIYDYVK